MFDKIKQFYNDHEDKIKVGLLIATGGMLAVAGVMIIKKDNKIADLQTFHDDIYSALKNGFNVVLDSESVDGEYVVKLIDPASEAIDAMADVAVAALEASKDAK